MAKESLIQPYKKGDIIELDIIDLGTEGEGIGKTGAFTWFVKDTVPGDRVKALVMKLKKNYAYARLLEIIEASKDRIEAVCPVARACGGCNLQSMSYNQQLKFKDDKLMNNLYRIGKFPKEMFQEAGEMDMGKCIHYPIISMENPWRYRNKSIYPIAEHKGSIVYGFYAGRSHSIVALDDCLIGVEENKLILKTIVDFMNKYHISAYNEEEHKGTVRNVLIRKGFKTGDIMVCLVINAKELKYKEKLVDELIKVNNIKSISYNINTIKHNVILGEEEHNIYGERYIYDYIDDIKFRISAKSFFQVNPAQTRNLYDKVLEFAGIGKDDVVWDLYCGIGSISLYMSKLAKKVYGIEIVPPAVEDAIANAKLNNIKNAHFLLGEAEVLMPRIYEEALRLCSNIAAYNTSLKESKGLQETDDKDKSLLEQNDSYRVKVPAKEKLIEKAHLNSGGDDAKALSIRVDSKVTLSEAMEIEARDILAVDCIVLDPPRKGCDKALLDTILQISPKRVVYVSCDSATLARDLEYLCKEGYELKKVQGVDMFPWTVHVETIVLLSKLDSKKYISVELPMDDMDLTSAESKATYKQIQNYVLEKFGFKVSTLYIAQVKRKYGLDIREHYNISNNESREVPQCSIEKEEAILDALKHFKML